MRVEVMYRGRASVHQSMETKANRAAQFCSCGLLNIFTSASHTSYETCIYLSALSGSLADPCKTQTPLHLLTSSQEDQDFEIL